MPVWARRGVGGDEYGRRVTTYVASLEPLDWIIVAFYGLIVVAVGAVAHWKQKTADDYMLGGRRIPWWLLGVSLIATAFSSISLLGWTGKGYSSGPQWLQLQVGELLAIILVCLIFLPFFSRQKLTTAYEYLERRFGPRARWFASALFHLQVLARAGLFLFLTARAVSVFTDLNVESSILVVGIAAMLYSSVGGLGAVVWTDAVQLMLVLVGVCASIILILQDLPNGLSDVVAAFSEEGRPPPVNTSGSMEEFPSLLSAALAYGVLALSVAGTNQQPVQRYLACRDLKSARRAALLSWGIGFVIVALTLCMGVALHVWFGSTRVASDDVLTTFIVQRVPIGLAGLLVAAIFAASMSSIDSAIHSMSTATLVDFVERLRTTPLVPRIRLRLARMLTLAHGVLAMGAAYLASTQGRDVIDLLLLWLGFLAGPVLGLFLLGMLVKRVDELSALLGVTAGYVAAIVFSSGLLTQVLLSLRVVLGHATWVDASATPHVIWAATAGCLATLLVGVGTSFVRGAGTASQR